MQQVIQLTPELMTDLIAQGVAKGYAMAILNKEWRTVQAAAEDEGISTTTFYKKMKAGEFVRTENGTIKKARV